MALCIRDVRRHSKLVRFHGQVDVLTQRLHGPRENVFYVILYQRRESTPRRDPLGRDAPTWTIL